MARHLALTGLVATMGLGQLVHSASHPRIVRNLLCIHRYEGSWTDPGAPYYGGLQMDWSFMQTYGGRYLRRWGTANHWPRRIQLAVGVRAVLVRGYSPWPVSAHTCGLL